MLERREAIQVEPGSELDHLLEAAADTEILLEQEGVRYRLNRIDAPVVNRASPAQRQPLDPRRVGEIIGLGESAGDSHIARRKDQYIADAADHRGR